MKKILCALTLLISVVSFSQTKYLPGFFVTNQGTKVECLIRNVDWYKNPTEIEYKIQEEVLKKDINEIIEFGINDDSKFVRYEVDIDVSSQLTDKLTSTRNPTWETKTLLLKVLIEGKASLYSYETGQGVKYFYRKEKGKIEQLIYRKFLAENLKLSYNYDFIYQLNKDVNCDGKLIKIGSVDYNKNDLLNYFQKYNECSGGEVTFENKSKPTLYNLYGSVGIGIASTSSNNTTSGNTVDYKDGTSFRIGAIGEMILPFNNYKWALTAEVHYQTFSSKGRSQTTSSPSNSNSEIKYSTINPFIGARHYIFLNTDSKLYLEAAYCFYDIEIGKNVLAYKDIRTGGNLFLGLGYQYNNLGASVRYYLNKDLLTNYAYYKTDHNEISLNLSYKF